MRAQCELRLAEGQESGRGFATRGSIVYLFIIIITQDVQKHIDEKNLLMLRVFAHAHLHSQ